MKIDSDILQILRNCETVGNALTLPAQLDRAAYVRVNKVLEAIGGKWNRKAKAHIFPGNAAEAITQAAGTGTYTDKKKEYQFFETPDELARQLVIMADLRPGDNVLEPSAGRGAIAKHMPGCYCYELEPSNRQHLIDNGFYVVGEDFITADVPDGYDVIVANPPFTKNQDVEHVSKMIDLARRRVVSIMSAGVLFRSDKKTAIFREKVEFFGGNFIELPAGMFRESGTDVRTVICIVDTEI
jgi:predicted RNA methylase